LSRVDPPSQVHSVHIYRIPVKSLWQEKYGAAGESRKFSAPNDLRMATAMRPLVAARVTPRGRDASLALDSF
jgi:hypothetical protein